jgi:hypothetical protein
MPRAKPLPLDLYGRRGSLLPHPRRHSFPLAQAASNWNGTTGQTRKPVGIEAGKVELCLTSMV